MTNYFLRLFTIVNQDDMLDNSKDKVEKKNTSTFSTEPKLSFLDTLIFQSICEVLRFFLLITWNICGMVGVKMKNPLLLLPWLTFYMFFIVNIYIHVIYLFVEEELTEGVVCILHGQVYIFIWFLVRYVFKDIKKDKNVTDRESKMAK